MVNMRMPMCFRRGRALRRGLLICLSLLAHGLLLRPADAWAVRVGFGHADITPDVDGAAPVWIAGYGPGRQATGVHDPLFARCVVLENGGEKIALISLDAIGLQLPDVERIRALLADYRYVLVSSTHDHEAPDVIGIWGKTPLHRGADDAYLELLVQRAAAAVRLAESQLQEATADFGTAEDADLLNDSRLARRPAPAGHPRPMELSPRGAGFREYADHGRFSGRDDRVAGTATRMPRGVHDRHRRWTAGAGARRPSQ
jgi:hypothetical protein